MDLVEKIVAKLLLDIKAVRLSPDAPFTWASGWKSPIYCDNRKILSFPEQRKVIYENLAKIVKDNYTDVQVIAGVATGAISWGALVAEKLGLPFVYVRPKPKDHGTGAQIEGYLPEGAGVVVVEDLISTGASSLSAVECLNRSGANVLGMVAIFSYNFDVSRRSFEYANCELRTLTNYDKLIEEALSSKYIKEEEMETLRQWRYRPEIWGK
ncbi:MAG: orotate phosphoribosyltransferase [Bacteroidales bacterium]|nr:orotate phosphoribosyltransferase [Bacteroidales bacterium]